MFYNPLVFLADLVVPPLIGFVFCLLWGGVRGALMAVVPMLLAVYLLFFLQVSGPYPDGSTRAQGAWWYMRSELAIWFATFIVGAGLGWLVWKLRPRGA
jgi:hypothetical protein